MPACLRTAFADLNCIKALNICLGLCFATLGKGKSELHLRIACICMCTTGKWVSEPKVFGGYESCTVLVVSFSSRATIRAQEREKDGQWKIKINQFPD